MLTTIFATFASLSIAGDTISTAPGFWAHTIAASLFTGLLGVGYAAGGFGYRWLLPFVVALNIFGPSLVNRFQTPAPRPTALSAAEIEIVDRRLSALGVYRIGLAIVGYVAFIRVLRREGRRSVAAQTEIRLAREIHASLVPVVSGSNASLEWFGVSRPSGDVGGDLVDVIVPAETEWAGCVADVSGHGVAAGVLMGMFKTALRSAYGSTIDPAASLTQVNAVLCPLKQSNMFVTAAALSSPGRGHFEYALAGHPSILHVPPGGTARWVGESQLAVGLIDAARYSSSAFDAGVGDLVAIVTDGLIEIFDKQERELGAEGLRQIVERAAAAVTLEATAAAIFDGCAAFGPRTDDQSLLLVRVRRTDA